MKKNKPSGIRIVRFTEQHLPEAARLYRLVFREKPWDETWRYGKALLRLRCYQRMPRFTGFVAREKTMVGFIMGHREEWIDGTTFFIDEICVHPAHQRAGLGGALMNALLERLSGEGIPFVSLITMRKSPARVFYEKYGFETDNGMVLMVKEV